MVEPELTRERVSVARDLAGAARLLAQEVVAHAQAAVALRGRFTLALSGGHTPQALHALLADPEEPFRGRIAWAATEVFFGDERCVGPDHPHRVQLGFSHRRPSLRMSSSAAAGPQLPAA